MFCCVGIKDLCFCYTTYTTAYFLAAHYGSTGSQLSRQKELRVRRPKHSGPELE